MRPVPILLRCIVLSGAVIPGLVAGGMLLETAVPTALLLGGIGAIWLFVGTSLQKKSGGAPSSSRWPQSLFWLGVGAASIAGAAATLSGQSTVEMLISIALGFTAESIFRCAQIAVRAKHLPPPRGLGLRLSIALLIAIPLAALFCSKLYFVEDDFAAQASFIAGMLGCWLLVASAYAWGREPGRGVGDKAQAGSES